MRSVCHLEWRFFILCREAEIKRAINSWAIEHLHLSYPKWMPNGYKCTDNMQDKTKYISVDHPIGRHVRISRQQIIHYLLFMPLLLPLLLLLFYSPFSSQFAPIKLSNGFDLTNAIRYFILPIECALFVLCVLKQQLFFVDASKMICHPVRWINEHPPKTIISYLYLGIVKCFHKKKRVNILPPLGQDTNKRFVFLFSYSCYFFFCFYLFSLSLSVGVCTCVMFCFSQATFIRMCINREQRI